MQGGLVLVAGRVGAGRVGAGRVGAGRVGAGCREGRPLRESRGSLGSSKLSEEDEGSMGEYGDVDPGKFTEDGSFVGVYTNTADRRRGRSEV